MKYVILFFGCLALRGPAGNIPGAGNTYQHPPNKIDTIHSAAAITSLLRGMGKDYSDFTVAGSLKFSDHRTQRFCDSIGTKLWTKADFDDNGYTDLLVYGNWPDGHRQLLCIMDRGENDFFVIRLTRRAFGNMDFAIVKDIDNKPSLLAYSFTPEDLVAPKSAEGIIIDTLVFRFNDFIERNTAPAHHSIGKIAYSTTRCFGRCPIFSMVINADRSAFYRPIEYNKRESPGNATIDIARYNQLTGLLNYIDFEKLKDKYQVDWTDDQTCTLVITYDNGKTKQISDYGLSGSFGLNKAYHLLFDLRENQVWK